MKMRMNSKTAGIVFLLVCLLIVLFIGQFVYLGSSYSAYGFEGATDIASAVKVPKPTTPVKTSRPGGFFFNPSFPQKDTKAPKPTTPVMTSRPDSPILLAALEKEARKEARTPKPRPPLGGLTLPPPGVKSK